MTTKWKYQQTQHALSLRWWFIISRAILVECGVVVCVVSVWRCASNILTAFPAHAIWTSKHRHIKIACEQTNSFELTVTTTKKIDRNTISRQRNKTIEVIKKRKKKKNVLDDNDDNDENQEHAHNHTDHNAGNCATAQRIYPWLEEDDRGLLKCSEMDMPVSKENTHK